MQSVGQKKRKTHRQSYNATRVLNTSGAREREEKEREIERERKREREREREKLKIKIQGIFMPKTYELLSNPSVIPSSKTYC